MLHGKYRVEVVVVLDDHAGTHLGGWNRHVEELLRYFLTLLVACIGTGQES
jgi:hypothetical protein